MKVAIIFADGKKQINFTPESDEEKMALGLITINDDIELAVKHGSFSDKPSYPYHHEVQTCKGGHLRVYDGSDSIMLVLTPKNKQE